jgi:hypothetical protein
MRAGTPRIVAAGLRERPIAGIVSRTSGVQTSSIDEYSEDGKCVPRVQLGRLRVKPRRTHPPAQPAMYNATAGTAQTANHCCA